MDILQSSFLCFVFIYLVNCEDSCDIKRVQNGDVLRKDLVPDRNSAGQQTRTKAIYFPANTSSSVSSGSSLYVRCGGWYTFQGGQSRDLAEITCTDGKWLPFPVCLLPPCDKRSLNYPGLDKGGERTYFHGESFEPMCQDGYQVAEKADKRIRCENGQWTGNSSPCTQGIRCKLPEKPDFGSMELIGNSTAVGSVVVFMCETGRELVGSVLSRCNDAGQWTSPSPRCTRAHCEMPDSPLFGSVELIGKNIQVGSMVNYKCYRGLKLVGSNVSTCLNTGEWTFPTPECVGQCVTPDVDNGELGEYEETDRTWWFKLEARFKEVPVGKILDEDDEVTLKCDENYVSKAEHLSETTIVCQRGNLTPVPECVPTSCLSDPPSIPNGRYRVHDTQHGSIVSYMCRKGYKLHLADEVKCVYGSWVGNPPLCEGSRSIRCDKSTLDYPGLIKSEGYIYNRRWFLPSCMSGFEVTESVDKRIHCVGGTWAGNLPPCTAVQALCTNDPPVPENGRIKLLLLRGSSVEYECLPHYEMGGNGNVVCDNGQWTGSPPTCKDSRCYLRNLIEKEGVDLTSDNPVVSNSKANIVCLKGYSLRYPEVYCERGEWETENLLSPCEENKCYLRNLKEKEGVILTNDIPVESNSKANIICVKGYSLRYPEVYCERGEWKTENVLSPCQKSDCEVKAFPNGEILKNRSAPVEKWLLNAAGIDTLHEPAVVGTFVNSGAILYVKCSNQHGSRGALSERLVPITCRSGEWTPLPDCQRTKGCTVMEKKSQSDILFSPDKEFYNLGESVIFWCPLGKDLTTDVQRSLCFTTGWTPDIPDCQ